MELAEFIEDLLPNGRRGAIEEHLDTCEDCRSLLAALVDTMPGDRAGEASVRARESGTLDVGTTLGRYELTRHIGVGGMGKVLGARDRELDRDVAIKVLHGHALSDELRLRLRAEARALARLDHPHVVTVYAVEREDGHDFVVMELVEGETLAQWQAGIRLWRDVVAAYLQAGRGLSAAHGRGLIHRDFKPSNCIRDAKGRVKVLDFGLVREISGSSTDPSMSSRSDSGRDEQPALTRTGAILGTVAYMPLEQLRGAQVDARSDQWSLCASLFEALTGKRPFGLGRSLEEHDAFLDSGLLSSTRPSHVPRTLWRALVKGLATRPEDRWPSMDELLVEFERAVAPPRRWWLLAVGGLVSLALAWWWPTGPSPGCAPAESRLDGVWDETARALAHDGLIATEVPYAEKTWERLAPRLDDYAERWAVEDERMCRQSVASGDSASSHLEARRACISDRRRRLRALVQVLASADAGTVERAADAAGGLPSVEACDDLRPGDALDLAPQDPELASRLERLREQLADVEALTNAGRFDEGFERLAELRIEAADLDHPPIGVEVELLEGRLRGGAGRFGEATQTLDDTFHHAVRVGREDVATDAALFLIYLTGQELEEYDDARSWARHAQAHAARIGDAEGLVEVDLHLAGIELRQGRPDRALALYRGGAERMEVLTGGDDRRTLEALGGVAHAHLELGQLDQARRVAEQVLERERTRYGPEHPAVAKRLHLLSSIYHQLGDLERDCELLREVIAIRERVLGPTHPHVMSARHNLGMSLLQLGEAEAAGQLLEQVLRANIETLGPDHGAVAETLQLLSWVDLEFRRYDSAEQKLRRALTIYERVSGPEHYKNAEVLELLAHIHTTRDEPVVAFELQQRALEIAKAAHGPDHYLLANYLYNLGAAHAQIEQYEQAIVRFAEAVELRQEQLGPDDPQLAFALTEMGSAYLDLGEPAEARAPLLRALDIRERSAVSPSKRALTRFTLARALDDTDRLSACEHARKARDEYGQVEGDRTTQIAKLDAWLRRCDEPG